MAKKSTQDIVFNIVIPIIIFVTAIIAVIVPISTGLQGKNCVDRTVLNKNGSDIVGYSMENLKNIGYFEFVNHFPNQYVMPNKIGENGLIESTNDLTLAPYGTLQFVIFNFDKKDPNFENYLMGEDFYSPTTKSNLISFYIPFAYDAATIWVNGEYYTTNGRIKDYSPEDYSSEQPLNVDFQRKEPSRIVLTVEDNAEEISEDRFESAKIITIHYQAKRGVNFKNNIPIFGNPTDVLHSTTVKFTTSISAVVILAILLICSLAIMILKLSLQKLPYLGIVFGAFIMNIAQYISYRLDVITAKYIILIALSIIILFTIISCKPRGHKMLLFWEIITSLAILNIPLIGLVGWYASYKYAILYSRISFIVLILLEHFFAIIKIKNSNMMEMTGIAVALIVPILSLFFNFSLIWFINPSVILINVSAVVLLWNIIESVRILELKNKKLTDNLMAEVASQTHSLHNAIQDRELLISFISHDLRKASISIDNLSTQIIEDQDRINSPIAEKIKIKNGIILDSLSDISNHMKQNFSSETFSVVKVNDLFNDLQKQLGPDCEAYGIKMNCEETHLEIRTKQGALMSILSNLIFNAIEHAECQNINIYAKTHKDKVNIYVHDDGKGIENKENVFSPFVTGNDTESNMGLGLFLIKSEIEALGGSINYVYDNGAKFILTLLREF